MCDRPCLSGALLFSLLLALAAPTAAQTIEVRNGGTIELENGGVWDLKGTTVDLGGTGSTASIAEIGGGRFTGGELTVTRDLNAPSQATPANLGAEISSGENLGATTVTRGHAAQTGSGNQSIERFYDIAPTNNSGLGATLTIIYHDAELNGLSEGALEFFRSTDGGSTWSEEGQDGRDANANTVTLNNVDALSRWTLGSENSPLPVELTAFDAQADGEAVRLTWRTASETHNAGFHVQRRRVGARSWTELDFVDGHGTTTEPKTYSFRDDGIPYEADSLSYRLKQVNQDGTFEHSESVMVALGAPDELTLRGNVPNPFYEQTTIRYELPQSGTVQLAVYNALGQRVATLANGKQEAGRHGVSFTSRDLPSGVYFVRLSADGKTRTQKMTVLR